MQPHPNPIHATCICVDGKGLLIIGPSGSGKSGLALQMIALGAKLVSDDRTVLKRIGGDVIASSPASITGLIEARNVGILRSPSVPSAPLRLVVDMGQQEKERLPRQHVYAVEGVTFPCLHRVDATHFAAALLLYLKGGITTTA